MDESKRWIGSAVSNDPPLIDIGRPMSDLSDESYDIDILQYGLRKDEAIAVYIPTHGVDLAACALALKCAMNIHREYDKFDNLRKQRASISEALRKLPAPTEPPAVAVEKQRKELIEQLTQIEADLKQYD